MSPYSFLALLVLATPLVAIKCNYGSSTGSISQIDCGNGKYCSTEITQISAFNNGGSPSTKTSYSCGSNAGDSGIICTMDGTYSPKQEDCRNCNTGNCDCNYVTKVCCSGDYCNSSGGVFSLLTLVATCLTLFLNKI